ncbi:hypothetical protein K1719_042418 [Acacia pycnantha]|nr:hypothetical protein K1719_042418 [Acacia pycnantha]
MNAIHRKANLPTVRVRDVRASATTDATFGPLSISLSPTEAGASSTTSGEVDVPEWLSGMTRNHVGFARAGSNPAVHVFPLENKHLIVDIF